MTEINENEWDLADVLADRAQPKDEVAIYLNESASFAKTEIVKSMEKASDDELEKYEAALDKVNAELEASKWVVHIQGIPSRMREDIHSRALADFPLKNPTLFTDENVEERNTRENNLAWLAQITDVVNPKGQHRSVWTLEEMGQFYAKLTDAAKSVISRKIAGLTKASEQYTIDSKDSDF